MPPVAVGLDNDKTTSVLKDNIITESFSFTISSSVFLTINRSTMITDPFVLITGDSSPF